MAWLWLALAIVCEVTGTMALKLALRVRSWYVVVVVGYVAAFSLLSFALAEGIPLGAAYGIWVACGVALTALVSRVLFGEPFTRVMALGIVLIMSGVVLVETGSVHG